MEDDLGGSLGVLLGRRSDAAAGLREKEDFESLGASLLEGVLLE